MRIEKIDSKRWVVAGAGSSFPKAATNNGDIVKKLVYFMAGPLWIAILILAGLKRSPI